VYWGYTGKIGLRSTASVLDTTSDGGAGVENRVEGGVVVHLELAVKLETAAAGEGVRPEGVEAGGEVCTLFVQHGEAGLVAVPVLGGGAVELLFGVEDLEGEDGEAVDDEAGGFGVEWSGGGGGNEGEKGYVDLLGEVVAELVEAVDVVLDLDDSVVGGLEVAGLVFAVPEVVVGAVLVQDELVERRGGGWSGGGPVVAVRGELIVEGDDVRCVEHEVVMQG
jgi:hypothetical protein